MKGTEISFALSMRCDVRKVTLVSPSNGACCGMLQYLSTPNNRIPSSSCSFSLRDSAALLARTIHVACRVLRVYRQVRVDTQRPTCKIVCVVVEVAVIRDKCINVLATVEIDTLALRGTCGGTSVDAGLCVWHLGRVRAPVGTVVGDITVLEP